MASLITLQGSINWASAYLQYRPLTSGPNYEPSISNANIVRQTIMGPPFVWRWNRAQSATITTVAGTQDYSVAISDFGFAEKISLTNGTTTFEIPNQKLALGVAQGQERPQFFAPIIDDNAGNITFRFMPVPDKVYTGKVLYQKKPPLFTGVDPTTQFWAPIPDEMSYVYNQGMLAFSALYADDPRWQIELMRFLGQFIGTSEGLDETQKNLFLESWQLAMGQGLARQQTTQLGVISRGSTK